MEEESISKRRKIVITDYDDEEKEDVGSNPDVEYEDGEVLEEPEGEEEDLMENIYEYVLSKT